MGEVKNAFIKSKMNKDLDSRLIPSGEYRDASNVQVSRSESSDVGALESVLGNVRIENFSAITGANDISCIGFLTDEFNSNLYLFFTNYSEVNLANPSYNPSSSNFIFSYNTLSDVATLLVEGSFLNFSKTNPIYGVNLLENLLFWTDNRNQPRKINVSLANKNNVSNPTYYTNEDHISVAKYNPYAAIQTYQPSIVTGSSVGDYESTLKDVTSLYYPNGGIGTVVSSTATTAVINSVKGELVVTLDNYNTGASVSYIDMTTGYIIDVNGITLDTASYDANNSYWDITVSGGNLPTLTAGQKLVFNSNPYYDPKYAGDPSFLEDKFVRFAYRFKFDDGENSLFSTFTQSSFIPKQDGYFMYTDKENLQKVDDESNAYRSTVVSFVENKVNKLDLRIPLPFVNYEVGQALKITGIDVLYKESDGLSVKVVDTVSISDIENSSGVFTTGSSPQASVAVLFTNLKGGIKIGEIVKGLGITGYPTVVSFEYDENSTTSGVITLSDIQSISTGVELTIGDPNFLVYSYNARKPYKTLPSNEIIRVYDKVPVRALSQEIISNRVVYGNFQDKHTPPPSIDYNVLVSEKSNFNLNNGSAVVSAVESSNSVSISSPAGVISVGSEVALLYNTPPSPPPPIGDEPSIPVPNIDSETFITDITGAIITFSKDVTLSVSDALVFEPVSTSINTTSSVSHPNSSLKTNRTYQVGIVLSDRYGRQSTTILSNNSSFLEINGNGFIGSTLFSPYIDNSVDPIDWLGNSIKLSINKVVGTSKNYINGEPGVYDGDSTKASYNPLGWYSLKVVVKQNEQEYYNVYLPGIMASYPTDTTLELGDTSHAALTSDNINKVPRDLTEIGPDQKLYRSSVQLFGRVQNSSETITLNIGEGSMQYFPGTATDTVTSIAAMNILFDYNSQDPPSPNLFPQFYSFASNPLIAKISTNAKIGQIATTNFFTFSGVISLTATLDVIRIIGISGDTSNVQPGDNVTGPGIPEGVIVDFAGFTPEPANGTLVGAAAGTSTNEIQLTAGGYAVGDSLSGIGIPDVTFILDIVANPGAPSDVTLNQFVSVANGAQLSYKSPATLAITAPISVTAGNPITVTSFETPGIQQLAVYETEPVVSSLDIFWETATTALIGRVNGNILTTNSSGLAAAGINSYNTTPFTEALWPTQATPPVYPAIFTAPIYLVDAFGQQIPVSQINSPLTIATVISGGVNVQTPSPYFLLTETSAGSGQYNIVTTQTYMDNVYFNETNTLNNFTFNFTATVNGQPADFSETIVLGNKTPIILSSTSETGDFTSTIQTPFLQTDDQEIITLVGYNGSAGTVIDTLNPPSNRSKDLVWSIEDQVSATSNNPTTVNYFAIDSFTGAITNIGYQDTNMPADNYKVTVRLADPSLFVLRDVQVNMGLEVGQFFNKTITGRYLTYNNYESFPYTRSWFQMYIAPRDLSIKGKATVTSVDLTTNTATVTDISGTITNAQFALVYQASAKVAAPTTASEDFFFQSAFNVKDVVGDTIRGNQEVIGDGIPFNTKVFNVFPSDGPILSLPIVSINPTKLNTPLVVGTELLFNPVAQGSTIPVDEGPAVSTVNGITTVKFGSVISPITLNVGDVVYFKTFTIDFNAGYYNYFDVTNLNQTDPWNDMVSNSGTPLTGGVIQIPAGGTNAGVGVCGSWLRTTSPITSFPGSGGNCLPPFKNQGTGTPAYPVPPVITASDSLGPDPSNFTFEYVDP